MKMLGLTVIYSTNQNVNNSAQGIYKDKIYTIFLVYFRLYFCCLPLNNRVKNKTNFEFIFYVRFDRVN